MSDSNQHARSSHSLPRAKIQKGRFHWLLWLVPAAAILLCAWYVYSDMLSKGPTVTIYFDTIQELQEGSSRVMYRGAHVGTVSSIKLVRKGHAVEVQAQLKSSAADLARQGSQFWIVSPQVSVGGIRGLRTIVSGNYIAVLPGTGARTNVFQGLEEAPPKKVDGHVLDITLLAPNIESVDRKTPVFYRGIKVGEVLRYQLGPDSQAVVIHARILQEYAPIVRVNSKFWNAGGLSVSFGLFSGAQINAASPKKMITGGIAFATPTDYGAPATNGTAFRLYAKQDDSWKDWTPDIHLKLPQQAPEVSETAAPQSQ